MMEAALHAVKMVTSPTILVLALFSMCTTAADNGQQHHQPPKHLFAPEDIVFVILSQPNHYHASVAQRRRHDIQLQASRLQLLSPTIHLTHEEWPGVLGSWTILPLLNRLIEKYNADSTWFFMCEDITGVDLQKLIDLIRQLDPVKDCFVGHGLIDRESTIIHHFAFHDDPTKFVYPHFATGFLMAASLVKLLAIRLRNSQPADFSVDSKHELAMFIWDDGKGEQLKSHPQFCLYKDHGCATWIDETHADCGPPVYQEHLIISVKTCGKFHADRVPVIKDTWGKEAKDILYFSDTEDESIPTIVFDIHHVEVGHCAKTMAILRHAIAASKGKSWLVVADDDTLMSFPAFPGLQGSWVATTPQNTLHWGNDMDIL